MFSYRFKDYGTGVDELILFLGDERIVCDSIYFECDTNVLPGRHDAEKVREVIARLFEQWVMGIELLADGGSVYLLYDLSDQCSGWLECKREGEIVSLSRGRADVEGWSILPSEKGFDTQVPLGFGADGPTVRMTVEELKGAIYGSWAVLD